VNIDWYKKQIPKRVAQHNFIHNYEEIYEKQITLVNRIPIEKKKGRLSLSSKIDAKQPYFMLLNDFDMSNYFNI